MSTNKKTNAVKEVIKLSFNKFAKQLENVKELTEKKQKDLIYKYPENWTQIDIEQKGKAWRNNKRNLLNTMFNNILVFVKYDRIEDLKNEINKFEAFYKDFYLINNYEVNSLSQSKDKVETIKLCLDIIKEYKLQTEKKKEVKPKVKKDKEVKENKEVTPIQS